MLETGTVTCAVIVTVWPGTALVGCTLALRL
jgi:hypothetical protein